MLGEPSILIGLPTTIPFILFSTIIFFISSNKFSNLVLCKVVSGVATTRFSSHIAIPIFYKYDKSDIQNILCKSNNIECLINVDISYNFYPTPRIKIKDIVIKDSLNKKTNLISIDKAEVIISIQKHTLDPLGN